MSTIINHEHTKLYLDGVSKICIGPDWIRSDHGSNHGSGFQRASSAGNGRSSRISRSIRGLCDWWNNAQLSLAFVQGGATQHSSTQPWKWLHGAFESKKKNSQWGLRSIMSRRLMEPASRKFLVVESGIRGIGILGIGIQNPAFGIQNPLKSYRRLSRAFMHPRSC